MTDQERIPVWLTREQATWLEGRVSKERRFLADRIHTMNVHGEPGPGRMAADQIALGHADAIAEQLREAANGQ